ncbi:MAG: hypothetical protein QOE45_1204 [Frankiaceae bacterium]|jgi:hypothetical protein|nr:hypothetical protein [Frankiaceae bacterium]
MTEGEGAPTAVEPYLAPHTGPGEPYPGPPMSATRVPPGEHHEWTGAALRETPPVERAVRLALALAIVVLCAITATVATAGPRWVDDQNAVLRDAAAGRVVRVDATPDHTPSRGFAAYVRWRTRDGGRYESRSPVAPGDDIAFAVRRQPYVAAHPGSVTFGAVERPRVPFPLSAGLPLAALLGTLLLIVSPQPRWLTKWAWFWAFGTVVALGLYLLFGGAFSTGRAGASDRRLGAVRMLLLLIVLRLVAGLATDVVVHHRNPEPATGAYVAAAGR